MVGRTSHIVRSLTVQVIVRVLFRLRLTSFRLRVGAASWRLAASPVQDDQPLQIHRPATVKILHGEA